MLWFLFCSWDSSQWKNSLSFLEFFDFLKERILMHRIDFPVQRPVDNMRFTAGFSSSLFPFSVSFRIDAKKLQLYMRIATSEMRCSIRMIICICSIRNLLHSDDFIALQRSGWRTRYACPSFAVNYEYQSSMVEATLPGRPVSRTCFEYLTICASDFTAPVWNGRG